MCVFFRVIDLITPVSDAEQIPVQSLGIGLISLVGGVPRPVVTSLMAFLRSICLNPLPLYLPPTGPQKSPLLPPRGTGTAPSSAFFLELLRVAVRLHAGLRQRR